MRAWSDIITSLWNDSRGWKRTCGFVTFPLLVRLLGYDLPLFLPRIYLALVIVLDLCLDVSDTPTLVAVGRYSKPLLKNGGVYHYMSLGGHPLCNSMPVSAKMPQ